MSTKTHQCFKMVVKDLSEKGKQVGLYQLTAVRSEQNPFYEFRSKYLTTFNKVIKLLSSGL